MGCDAQLAAEIFHVVIYKPCSKLGQPDLILLYDHRVRPVGPWMQNYKCLRATVMSWVTLVNTQTHSTHTNSF